MKTILIASLYSFIFVFFYVLLPYYLGRINHKKAIKTIKTFELYTDEQITEVLEIYNFKNKDLDKPFTFNDYYFSGFNTIINN